ncbi:MAG: three-Cys-motif partner protein TcmP [Syntrophomonadaceae bacterium]|nr:three-Cys-motif partner protein TcmP [Syntrophomonadaceae bacterium]
MAYGGPWTLIKLDVIEKYLNFYVTAMKNNFKLCYIDAFAGEGEFEVKNIGPTTGSALRALDYPFDRYLFIEKLEENVTKLNAAVNSKGENNVDIIAGDCNELLSRINSVSWYKSYWRGVIFLDPYAMELKWDSLKTISQTKAFDVWYLFPLSALTRNLRRDGKIDNKTKGTITSLLGTTEWETEMYFESPQMALFGETVEVERVSINNISKYIVKRLRTVFPGVADNPLILRNPINNSPLFLLCFAVSNQDRKAIELSLKAANHILTHSS